MMAFQGKFNNITQLINLIALSKRNGTLTLFRRLEKQAGQTHITPVEAVQLDFVGGKLCGAAISGQCVTLVDMLRSDGKITQRQAELFAERALNTSDKALALALVQRNYVTRYDVIASLSKHISGVIRYLLSWKDGAFRFDQNDSLSLQRIAVDVNLASVARETLEIQTLTQYLPSLDANITLTKDYRQKLQQLNLSVDSWQVISYVNTHSSLHQIARELKLSGVRIRQILYHLEQVGIVSIRPKGSEQSPIQRIARNSATLVHAAV